MEVKDYCKNLQMELTGWKAKLYDVVRNIDRRPTGEKQKLLEDIEGFHILMTELDDRIDQLQSECPTDWDEQRQEIQEKIGELQTKWEKTEQIYS